MYDHESSGIAACLAAVFKVLEVLPSLVLGTQYFENVGCGLAFGLFRSYE